MAESTPVNPKDALGIKKVPMHLIPTGGLVHEARAMANGAAKYGPFNWRDKKIIGSVYIAAALRHIYAYLDGEDNAPDSGVHHLGHARACLGILLDAMETDSLEDDRVIGAMAAMLERFNQ